MNQDRQTSQAHLDLLLSHLTAALAEADRCDPLVAIHVQTALELLRERLDAGDQSNAR